MKSVTCVAPVNIAVIKYWGKRDENLILPINDSLSCSLNTSVMCAKTTISASPNFESSRFWLNGVEQSFDSPRLKNCLEAIKNKSKNKEILNWHIRICSENNFPTAAGLASSAAGYACLVFALSKLYEIEGDISQIARLGSGSACRSVFGGWVQWFKGSKPDGSDSIAKPIAPFDYWPEMMILILVVNAGRKKLGSSLGMQQSCETSELLKYRSEVVVPKQIKRMEKAILERNYPEFAKVTMQDSNSFHAVCQDTYPPISYLNDVSHFIINLVHNYNEFCGIEKVAYTFDAGPNACLYLLEPAAKDLLALIKYVFPSSKEDYIIGLKLNANSLNTAFIEKYGIVPETLDKLESIIITNPGEGPQVLSEDSSLLNPNGIPK